MASRIQPSIEDAARAKLANVLNAIDRYLASRNIVYFWDPLGDTDQHNALSKPLRFHSNEDYLSFLHACKFVLDVDAPQFQVKIFRTYISKTFREHRYVMERLGHNNINYLRLGEMDTYYKGLDIIQNDPPTIPTNLVRVFRKGSLWNMIPKRILLQPAEKRKKEDTEIRPPFASPSSSTPAERKQRLGPTPEVKNPPMKPNPQWSSPRTPKKKNKSFFPATNDITIEREMTGLCMGDEHLFLSDYMMEEKMRGLCLDEHLLLSDFDASMSSVGTGTNNTRALSTLGTQSLLRSISTHPNTGVKLPLGQFIVEENQDDAPREEERTTCVVSVKGINVQVKVPKGCRAVLVENWICIVPARKRVVDATKYALMLRDAAVYACQKDYFKPTYSSCHLKEENAKRIIGCLVALNPKISSLSLEAIAPFLLGAFLLEEFNSKIPISSLILQCPSRQTYENYVEKVAIDTWLVLTESIAKAGVFYLGFDKGDSIKQGSHGGFSKNLSWFAPDFADMKHPDGQIMVMCIDADACGNTSKEAANAIIYSVNKLQLNYIDETVHCLGFTTDSGGGGTIESVATPLKEKAFLSPHALIGSCTLHNLSLVIVVPARMSLLGPKGGVASRTFLQCIYAGYAFLEEVGKDVCKKVWSELISAVRDILPEQGSNEAVDDSCEDVHRTILDRLNADIQSVGLDDLEWFKSLELGSETRWFTIGAAAEVLFVNRSMWIAIAEVFDGANKGMDKAKKIAQDFLSQIKEKTIVSDLAFMAGFHNSFVKEHAIWMQKKDRLTQKAGYQSFNILSRIFLMRKKLNNLIENYPGDIHFSRFVDLLEHLDEPSRGLQKEKAALYLQLALDEFDKMFTRWEKVELAFLAAFSEVETGKLVSSHLLGMQYDRSTLCTYHSDVHGCTIDLKEFATYLDNRVLHPLDSTHAINLNEQLLRLIVEGLNIWEDSNEFSKLWKLNILKRYAAFPSNQQGVERAVKAQNLAASNERREKNVGIRLAATSLLMEMAE
jgi:hypothetical protein